jgi:SAM-dependent methyltransferase
VEGLIAMAQATRPEPYARPDLYDLLYDGFDEDLVFYRELAAASGGPVLDLACGTGRMLFRLLEAGLEVVGVDLSEAMLARLADKARARGLAPALHRARMDSFDLGRRFRAVVIPFNAFAHNLTADEQIATLRRCHDHLEPGGVLALDIGVPPLERLGSSRRRRTLEREVAHPETGLPVRLWNTQRLDPVAQIQEQRYEIEETVAGGAPRLHVFETRMRWAMPAEMDLLLRHAGFGRRAVWGDFDRIPASAHTGLVVAEAWREDA